MEHKEILIALDALIRCGMAVIKFGIIIFTLTHLARFAFWLWDVIREAMQP